MEMELSTTRSRSSLLLTKSRAPLGIPSGLMGPPSRVALLPPLEPPAAPPPPPAEPPAPAVPDAPAAPADGVPAAPPSLAPPEPASPASGTPALPPEAWFCPVLVDEPQPARKKAVVSPSKTVALTAHLRRNHDTPGWARSYPVKVATSAGAPGSVKKKVAPRPTAPSAQMLPPCRWTIR